MFPGYHPMGYQPGARPDPPAEISAGPPTAIKAGQKRWAQQAGAEWIADDGYYCYRWNNGRVESKQWYGERYSMNWMDTGKDALPPGVVKVE